MRERDSERPEIQHYGLAQIHSYSIKIVKHSFPKSGEEEVGKRWGRGGEIGKGEWECR